MNHTNANIYKNTARSDVLNFVQSLNPTPIQSLYLDKIFTKNSLSMRDTKVFLEIVAHSASERLVSAEQLDALGLPILPIERQSVPSTLGETV